MTAGYDHLTQDCREEAMLPPYERIRRVQAERWIGYPRAELILNRLNELLHYPQRDRMPCLLLYAATGMGKTKILRKFRREHPDTFDDKAGVQRMPVVALQMPPEPDEKSFYTQLLASLNAPVRYSMNVHQMRHVVRELLTYIGTQMLIVDEVHTLLASTYRQQRILLNTLRYLANELRWQNDEAFVRLLASFQAVFPLREKSDLTAAASRRLLLDRTEGVTVRIVRSIHTARSAVAALRSTLHAAAALPRSRYLPSPPHTHPESLRQLPQRPLTRP
jgi:hypothetical protein